MAEIVHRIDAPSAARAVVVALEDAVNGRVAHDDVGRGHVNFGPQRAGAFLQLAILHLREEGKVFLNAAAAIWAVLARLGQRAAIFAHLIAAQVADIGFA